VDENHRALLLEIGHLKKRHARLLSLYSEGLEQQMAKDELKIEELGEQQYSKEQYPLQELI
jgi:hypothetical protein